MKLLKMIAKRLFHIVMAFAIAFMLPTMIMIIGGMISPALGLSLWKLSSILCPVAAILWLLNKPWVVRIRVRRKRAKIAKEAAEAAVKTARAARKGARYAKVR